MIDVAVLDAEAAGYQWLAAGRVRTVRDVDLAGTVARLYDEREQQRARAEAAEQALREQIAVNRALRAGLDLHNERVGGLL